MLSLLSLMLPLSPPLMPPLIRRCRCLPLPRRLMATPLYASATPPVSPSACRRHTPRHNCLFIYDAAMLLILPASRCCATRSALLR